MTTPVESLSVVELLPEVEAELKRESAIQVEQSRAREKARLLQIEQQKEALPLTWQETRIDAGFDELTAYLNLQDQAALRRAGNPLFANLAEPSEPFERGVQEINGVWVYQRSLRWRDEAYWQGGGSSVNNHFCQFTATLFPDDKLELLGESLAVLHRAAWMHPRYLNRCLARTFLTPLELYRLETSIWKEVTQKD